MSPDGPWTNADYPSMSWHDVPVYGFSLERFAERTGTCEVVLDIDFILEWIRQPEGIRFRMCRAELRFFDVFGFRVRLDYATATAGMCPFAIDGIVRSNVPGVSDGDAYDWQIPVTWPPGEIAFQASGFRQTLVGESQVTEAQQLDRDAR